MAEPPTRIDDALTDVRKRDWQRLVRAAAGGERFELADDRLERRVLLAAPDATSEVATSMAVDGPPRATWLHGRAAARLRGRMVMVLLQAVLDAPDDLDDVLRAYGLVVYSPTQTVAAADLTAREGRRLLADVAQMAPGRWAVTIRHTHGPAHVMLTTEPVLDATAPVSISDGDEVVAGGLYTLRQLETLLDVGHAAWVDEQADQPWTPEQAVEVLAAASRAAGMPLPPPA